jgi:hypothetical protein
MGLLAWVVLAAEEGSRERGHGGTQGFPAVQVVIAHGTYPTSMAELL